MKNLMSEKLFPKIIEISSIAFVGAGALVHVIPILATFIVACSLVVLNLAKAFKIYHETIRENEKQKTLNDKIKNDK